MKIHYIKFSARITWSFIIIIIIGESYLSICMALHFYIFIVASALDGRYFNCYVTILITVRMYRFVLMSTSLFTTLELHHIKLNK